MASSNLTRTPLDQACNRIGRNCLFGMLLFVATLQAASANEVSPTDRRLGDYKNADGSMPDGRDNQRDDSSALNQALAAGPGIVHIGPGYYRFSEITIPSGVMITGSGDGTIVRPSGSQPIFVQSEVDQWRLRDLTLDGEAQGEWQQRRDEGQTGLEIDHCYQFEVAGVVLRNFNGAALQLSHFGPDPRANGVGNLDRISALDNYIGIRFDERAEYVSATQLICCRNVIGCAIHAGNLKITASNFCNNVDGMLIEDKVNGSHGTIGNCLFNNNLRHALVCRKVAYGMAITGCHFGYAKLLIADSTGVNISGGIVSCDIVTEGSGVNRISGNYVVPEHTAFTLAPATIVTDNFTSQGQWEANNR